MKPLKINPEYLALVPRPTKEEYDALERDIIEKKGATEPIVINERDEILDGHTRFEICNKYALFFDTRVMKFKSINEEKKYIIEIALLRRHLSAIAKAKLYRTLETVESVLALERQKEHGGTAPGKPKQNTSGNISGSDKGDTRDVMGAKAGVSGKQWDKITAILDEGTEEEIKKADSGEESVSMVFSKLRARLTGAHVGNATGEYEWYTPSIYIEAAREMMGSIDVDPASSEVANEIVKSTKYYTLEVDGLIQNWDGNVWMNPPYSQPLITEFCDLLIEKIIDGEVKQACVLVNNATETNFYQNMLNHCKAVCFIKGRVRFIDKNGKESGAPLQGQTILYFGYNTEKFGSIFSQFGVVLYAKS